MMKMKKSVFMLIVILMGTLTQLGTAIGTIHAYAQENDLEVLESTTSSEKQALEDSNTNTENISSSNDSEKMEDVKAKEESAEVEKEEITEEIQDEEQEMKKNLDRAGGRDIVTLEKANQLPKDKEGRPTILTSVVATLNGKDVSAVNSVGIGDEFQITYQFNIPDAFGKDMLEGDYFDFKLPDSDAVALTRNQEGELVDPDNGNVYGKYYGYTNGDVKMVFNDKVKANDHVDGSLMFSVKVDERKISIPQGYEVEFPYTSGDNSSVIYVSSSIKSYIQKQYVGISGNTPEWKVLINPNSLKINQLNLTEKTTYRYANSDLEAADEIRISKMKKAKVDMQGNITEGEEVAVANKVFDKNGNIDLGFDYIEEPYAIYLDTPLKFGVTGKVTNRITLSGNADGGHYLNETASATQQLGKDIIKKEPGNYDKQKGEVDWKITYNPEGIHIPKEDAKFTDTMTNGTYVEGSMKVSPDLPYDLDVKDGGGSFDFAFKQDVDQPVIITYKAKVKNTDDKFTVNTVISGGQKVISSKDISGNGEGEGGEGDGSSSISKAKPVDSQGGVAWELNINKEKQQLDKWWVTDKVDSGKIRKSSFSFKRLPGGGKVSPSDYDIEWIEEDGNYAKGFTVRYNKPTSDQFKIEYITEFERNTNQSNHAMYHYVVDGNEKEDDDTQTYIPKQSAEIGLAKSGRYIPESNEIEWEVVVNHNEKVAIGPNNLLLDPIMDDQIYVKDSAKVQYKYGISWQDMVSSKVSFDESKKQLEVRGFMEANKAQRVIFRTKLKDPMDIVRYEIKNTAYYEDKYTPKKDVTGTLTANIGNDLFLKKEGKVNPVDPNLLDWHVDVNPHGYHLKNLEIFDDSWENQVIIRETIQLTDSSGNLLKEGYDYSLDYTERSFHIKMLHDINEKLDLTYQGRVVFPAGSIPGDTKPVKNKIRMTAQGIYTTSKPIEVSVPVKVSDSSGIIHGKTRDLNVKKVSADNSSQVLAGAEFELYRGIIKDPNKIVDRATTDNSGKALFTKLTKGDYLLVETKAPAGYSISSEMRNGRVVRVSDEGTTTVEETVENSKGGEEFVEFPVEKKWEKVPTGVKTPEVTVRLFAGTVEKESMVLNSANNYKGTFKDLPKYENGKEILYTIKEDPIINYDTEINEGTVTNTYNNQEKTRVTGEKRWKNDEESNRPDKITIQLQQNGKDYKTTDAYKNNGWKYEFNDLPKVDNQTGKDYEYTVKEIGIPDGYTSEVDEDNNIINTYTKSDKTSLSGKKIWNDNGNRPGKRPASITVELLQNGKHFDEKEVTSSNNWAYEFNDLPKTNPETGKDYEYTVREVNVPDGYDMSVNGNDIINTYEKLELVSVSGQKKWEGDTPDKRPGEITVKLFKNGVYDQEKQVTSANNWKYTFDNLPKYKDNSNDQNIYTVEESNLPEGYDYISEVDGNDIINHYKPTEENTIDIEGKKVWEDQGNKLGLRPTSVTINLYKKDKDNLDKPILVTSQQVSGVSTAGFWSYQFEDLPEKDANGRKIDYFVEERDNFSNYTSEKTGNYDVTNTINLGKTEISGEKFWHKDQEKDRPGSIEVILYAESKTHAKKEVKRKTVTSQNNWKYDFKDLDKYDDRLDLIEYTVGEEPVEGYTTDIKGNDIHNTLEDNEEFINIEGQKHWVGDENYLAARPSEVIVYLYQNDAKDSDYYKRETTTAKNNWKYEFDELPKKDADGKIITYRVEEGDVFGYTPSTGPGKYDITNTYHPNTVDIKGKKTWLDKGEFVGQKPKNLRIDLQRRIEGSADNSWKWVESKTIYEPDWEYEFLNQQGIDKSGKPFEYRVVETGNVLNDYNSTSVGHDLHNTPKNKKTSMKIVKRWVNEYNDTSKRPESITVRLYQDGILKDTKEMTEKDKVGNVTWEAEFENLDVYNMATGNKYNYTIEEDPVPNYETAVKPMSNDKMKVEIHNTLKPTIDIEGEKKWEDEGFSENRPSEVIIDLSQNGTKIDETKATKENNWKYSFKDLPEKDNKNNLYVYTVSESNVPAGYKNEVNKYDITNIYTNTELTSVSGEKIWDDYNNEFKKRPEMIKVNLYQNDKLKDTQEVRQGDNGKWEYKFEKLQVKDNQDKPYIYRVDEETPVGYESKVEGTTITNTYRNTELTKISGEKIWDDYENKFETRPESILVELYKNDKYEKNQKVKGPSWKYTFDGLEKYDDKGKEYKYTVKEKTDENASKPLSVYKSKVDGYNIYNTYVNEEKTKISVEKKWDDQNNKDKERLESVDVHLLQNGTRKQTKTLNDENSWKHTFSGLDKYDINGNEYVYDVVEEGVENYITSYDKSNPEEVIITNKIAKEKETAISGKKIWDDYNNKFNQRPKEVTIVLYQNGSPMKDEAGNEKISIANEANNWTYTFDGLPENDSTGDKYEYTVKEKEGVPGYEEPIVDQTNIINKYRNDEKVNIKAIKKWDDYDNKFDTRKTEIEIDLLKDNEIVESRKLNKGNDWTYEFKDLDKHDEVGEEYKYEIVENVPDSYEVSTEVKVEGDTTVFTLTNKYVADELTSIKGQKKWDDYDNKFDTRPDRISVELYQSPNLEKPIRSEIIEKPSEKDGVWEYEFTDLEKYNKETGEEIEYIIKEKIVDTRPNPPVYDTEIDGNNIINHYKNEQKIKFSGEKKWDDYNDKFDTRPEEVTLYLLANKEKVDETTINKKDNNWQYSFDNKGEGYLVYDEKGELYNYEVVEEPVPGYTSIVSKTETNNDITSYDITNKYVNNETTNFKGSKEWDDFNDKDGKRPEKITVSLYQGKSTTAMKEIEVEPDENGNWNYEFMDLPKYDENGNLHEYSVKEKIDGDDYVQVNPGPYFVNQYKKVTDKTYLEGEKVWKGDQNNKVDSRPNEVKIVLLRNGIPAINDKYQPIIKTVTAADSWKYKFDELDKYDSRGEEYRYSVKEVPVKGYETTISGNNVVNTYKNPEKTEVLGEKKWDDKGKGELRPEFVYIELYQNDNKTPLDTRKVMADQDGNWKYEFRGLAKYDDNLDPFTYTVKERKIPHYEASSDGDNNITNRYLNDEKTSISGEKIWEDMGNKLGSRPDKIEIELYQNGIPFKTQEVTADQNGNWNYTFDDLPKRDDNFEEYIYTVKETIDNLDHYENEIDGTTITNAYINDAKTSIKGTKIWDDHNNKLNTRPDSIMVYLYRNNGKVPIKKQKVIPDENGFWKYEFNDLPKYDKLLNEYEYSVKEGKVQSYNSKIEESTPGVETTIKNTYNNNEKTEISGYKAWKGDFDNKLGTRPEEITVELYQKNPNDLKEETLIDSKLVRPDDDGNWYYTFEGLDKYDADLNEYKYVVKEKNVPNYEGQVEETNIVNTYLNDDKTKVNVEKKWIDHNNKLNSRPAEGIIVELYQNNTFKEEATVKPDASGNWSHEFIDLPKYDKNLDEYIYTVKEVEVDGYETTVDGTTITNYYQNPEKTEVIGKKVWKDQGDKINSRPGTIEVELYQKGKYSVKKKLYATQFVQANGQDEWTYEFTDLPKYDNRLNEYEYTVKEKAVDGYTSEVEGTTITNTYKNDDVTGIKGEKKWDDLDNKLNVRPDKIYVDLYQGSDTKPFATEIVEADDNGNWEYEFVNLPKYTDELDEYEYHIKERQVPHYETVLDGTTITNTYENTDKVSINGEKIWVDYDNKLKTRPKTIQVDLYRNDEKTPIDSKTVKANKTGDWRYSFKNLPKYDDELNEINYSVKEQDVTNYDSEIDGTTITNTYQNNDVTSIKGEKRWDDKDNKLKTRPDSVTINLHQNGSEDVYASKEVKPDKSGNWSYEFTDLPKYDKELNLYEYTVTEEEVPHYKPIIEETIVTNMYLNDETTRIDGKKVWKDEDNKLNVRPKSIQVELYQNDSKKPMAVQTVKAGRNGDWSYKFTNLPKYDENLNEYRYSVKEQEVAHYEGQVEGTTITNTYINNEKTELKGEKKWEDKDDKLNVRPKSIKVDLYQNGTKIQEKTAKPDKAGNWFYEFKDLDKYDNKLNAYEYTVKEQEVAHYESQVEGTTITNTYHNDDVTEVKGKKLWNDEDNKLKVRPKSIEVNLYQNGTKFQEKTVKPDKAGNWNYEFKNLPKYDEKLDEYRYTVEEQKVAHYEGQVEGTTITNTYINNEKTELKGEKKWEDKDDKLNVRPKSIKVDLYQNGTKIQEKTVKPDKAGNWFYEFKDLDKYDNKLNAYEYTVKEQEVAHYESQVEGTTITNTYRNDEKTKLKGQKLWDDSDNKFQTRPDSITVEVYQDGKSEVVQTQVVKPDKSGEWKFEFKNLAKYDDKLNEIRYTLKEVPVKNYVSKVEGTTITNTLAKHVTPTKKTNTKNKNSVGRYLPKTGEVDGDSVLRILIGLSFVSIASLGMFYRRKY